jgi:hypothetical protein
MRLARLEQTLCPPNDGTFTLEELCRALWRREKQNFLKIARELHLGLLVTQFEREDSDRNHDRKDANPS